MLLLLLIFKANHYFVHGILGGHEISIRQAPYQVNYGDVCGGVLIHNLWVLTTAHCGNHTYIRIGSNHRLQGPRVKIKSHRIHPKYALEHKFDYDIQILRLHRRLHFTRMVSAIAISEGDCGDNIYVAGWGYLVERGEYSNELQQARLPVIPLVNCQNVDNFWYNNTLTPRMFCAGGGEEDACQGDSGGAAVSYGQLVGISSFGFGCGRHIPGVYINVSEVDVRNWIRHYTGI